PCGESRETVRDFVQSVLGVPISTGAVQRVIDRTSQALEPIHKALGEKARASPINHVDETSWFNEAKLCWLWLLISRGIMQRSRPDRGLRMRHVVPRFEWLRLLL
ncbi:transposase, partial [Thermodesulfobacteriota bacterium]